MIFRVFKTASASRSLPKEEDKKESAFEIESIDEESDKEEEEDGEEEEEWEGEVEEDGEIASRALNSPHLSDTREDIRSSSSSSALVYSPVKVRVPFVPLMKKAAEQPELTSDDKSASN